MHKGIPDRLRESRLGGGKIAVRSRLKIVF